MFVQPSSLIFLVIIGIWAAYFVQYWVRRREHLATIRSVDAFSETMRVLERRAPLPSVDHGGQAPRTYAVSPARAMRPQITVKRAEPHPAAQVEPAAPIEIGEQFAPADVAMQPGRATRGIVVLVGLVGTVIFSLLAAFGVLVSWSFVVPLAMAGIGFLWLRAGVQAEMKAKRAARGRARRATERLASPAPVPARRASASASPSAPSRQAPSPTEAPPVEREALPAQVAAPFDVASEVAVSAPAAPTPVEVQPAAQHEVVLPQLDEDDLPLTWDPRPVPRPTYTMKARAAERPVAPPLDAAPTAQAEHAAYDEVLQRRTAGG